MLNLAKKSGMRGSGEQDRPTAGPSQADMAHGANSLGNFPGHGDADAPVSGFVQADGNGHHHLNVTKVVEHIHGGAAQHPKV